MAEIVANNSASKIFNNKLLWWANWPEGHFALQKVLLTKFSQLQKTKMHFNALLCQLLLFRAEQWCRHWCCGEKWQIFNFAMMVSVTQWFNFRKWFTILFHEMIHKNIWRIGIKSTDLEIREFSWRKTTTPDVLATLQNNSRENLTH